MTIYKKLTLSLLTLIACLSFLVMGLVYYIDPLQQYRKASFYKPFYAIGYQRYLNPGIAKSFDYDSIITTTSIGDSLSTTYLNNQLTWRAVKLTIDDSTAYEQMRTIEIALKTGKVKNVLYPLHYSSFATKTPYEAKHDFPEYLYHYDEKFKEQVKYLLNIDVLVTMIPRLFVANVFGIGRDKLDADKAYMDKNDGAKDAKIKKSPTLDVTSYNYITHGDNSWSDYTKNQTAKYITNFDTLILPLLTQHTSVNFYLIFPPFHLDYYCRSLKDTQSILNFYLHVSKVVANLPNVKLYDFMSEQSIVTQHKYFPNDDFHYDTAANNRVIDLIKAEKNRVQNNYDDYSSQFIKEIQSHCSQYLPGTN